MTHLEAAYIATRWQLGSMTFQEFRHAVADWEVIPISRKGRPIGAILAKGPEVHPCVLPEYKRQWFYPGLWRALFVDRLRQYGVIKTCMHKSWREGIEFAQRIGFRLSEYKDNIFHYEYTSWD